MGAIGSAPAAESTVRSLEILPCYPAANIHAPRGSYDAEDERGRHTHQDAAEPPTEPTPDAGADKYQDFRHILRSRFTELEPVKLVICSRDTSTCLQDVESH